MQELPLRVLRNILGGKMPLSQYLINFQDIHAVWQPADREVLDLVRCFHSKLRHIPRVKHESIRVKSSILYFGLERLHCMKVNHSFAASNSILIVVDNKEEWLDFNL